LKHKETKDPKHGEATANRRSQRYSEDGKKDQQKKVGRKSSGETGRHKMKRANSLEEVSKSKLEDLTIQPYCRSIGGEDRTSEVMFTKSVRRQKLMGFAGEQGFG
jgi:hypothetical protein